MSRHKALVPVWLGSSPQGPGGGPTGRGLGEGELGEGWGLGWLKMTLLSRKKWAHTVLYPEKYAEHDGTNI